MESDKCDQEVFDNGVSLGVFAMSKQEAEAFCEARTRDTDVKHD
jgi:hypothetical protein